jgi:hypothetical protein
VVSASWTLVPRVPASSFQGVGVQAQLQRQVLDERATLLAVLRDDGVLLGGVAVHDPLEGVVGAHQRRPGELAAARHLDHGAHPDAKAPPGQGLDGQHLVENLGDGGNVLPVDLVAVLGVVVVDAHDVSSPC